MATAEYLLNRVSKAKEKKLKREGELKEAYRYILPIRDTMRQNKGNVQERGVIFDSTAKTAIEKYATKLQNLLTPAWEEWLKFEPGTDIPEEEQGKIQEQLDKVSKIAFAHIHRSNFYTAEHEAFLDLGISTGAIIVERNTRANESSKINCRSIPLDELVPIPSSRGTLDSVWREFTVKASEITAIWTSAKLPVELVNKMQGNENLEVKVSEGVEYDEKTAKYTMYVVENSLRAIMHEEEMDSSPFIVFRESLRPGDILGFGRGLRILEDVKTLNKLAENALRADGINSMPIFTALDSGAFNPHNIVLQPGSIISVASNEQSNPSLRPLEVSNGYTLSENRMEQLRAVINEAYLANPFGAIDQTPVRSATEIAARQADLFQTTAAAFGRLQIEFLEPFMKRCLHILRDEGVMPPLELDGKMVSIKFTSPFAKMQGSEEVKNIMQWLSYTQPLGPEINKLSVNLDRIPSLLAKNLGIPKELYKDATEIDATKKQLGQMAIEATQQGGEMPQSEEPPQGMI